MLGLEPDVATRAGSAPETAAPALSAVEAALAGLWSTTLQLKSVGARDDFFLLGGDSLQGARLLTSVKVVFGVEIPIQELSGRAATVAGMARLIEDARTGPALHRPGDVSPPTGATIPRRRDGGPAVLSDTQKRMWFLARLDPDSPAYNQSRAFRLSGEINVAALRRALGFVTQRHEILRTTFALVDDEPRQMPCEKAAIELRTVDLTATPVAEQEDALRQVLLAQARNIFDLESGSLLRCVLVRLSEREHVLLRVWHHIISDGWSAGIFDRELSMAYRAFATGHEPALPDLPIQYADYAAWQREWQQGEQIERQLGYWKEKLADMATLALPTDRPRPPVASHKGAHLDFDLPAPLAQGLRALGPREGATLFMTLLSAFQVLLYRYCGQDDIAVGTPIAGRRHSELEGLIGFFANTLVLRSDLSGNPRFCELLARVRESALGAYTHQDLPFEKLVEELAPARDMSRNPLFQVLFMLQNVPGAALVLEGVEVSPAPLETHSAKFDLTLSVRESASGLRARWEYATDLFDASTIERMARHFERLLESIVADPKQRIAELPLLTAPERHQLLVEWNDTAADYPRDRCIHELFEGQAARAPEAVAVVFEDRQLTYGELNARANRLAHHLIALGVGPGVLVGVCMERSLELIVGLLGILKAGGAYVPLDPGYPAKRLEFMLEDTGAPVLLTQQSRVDSLPQFHGRMLCLDGGTADIDARSESSPQTTATPESLAYLMYTSGSTGEPKGVLVPHRGVVRLVKGAGYVALNAEETLLHMAPLSFDASTFELWGALLNGGRVVLMPPGQPALAEIGDAIRRHRVTTLWLPAGLFHLMVDERLDDLKPLRQLLAGGDVLSGEHLVKARRALPGCRLVNGYGPTENTTFTCCYTVAGERELIPTVPIGRPIANTRAYILDPHLQPVPVGAAGVLYAGGDGVARGYWRQPELTAERFLADPFSAAAGARMYCTGDIARYLPDGNIQFLGRADGQVKLRGFRIELGEIEAVLSGHPAVRQAVAAVREDVPGGKRLVAYVVPADGAFSDTRPLHELLRERLPEYMRPSAYVVMESFPLTPNGKIDRRALPAPSAALADAYAPRAAPRDRVEQTLCTIWAETLGIERVGLDDNFFDLGGHSLLAAKLFSRLNGALGRTLPLATLFAAPTVRGLAHFYRDAARPPSTALVAISPSGALPPVFALPGANGNVLGYAALGRALGSEQPFYGLQSVGLDGAREPFESIEDMAAHNIREMRQVRPRGPYYVLGACFGATVAYEMARQLLEADDQVAFLGLLHPSSLGGDAASRSAVRIPAWFRRRIALGRFVAGRMRLYWEEMQGLGFTERMQFVRNKARLIGHAVEQRDVFRGDQSEFNQRRVYDANVGALLRYKHAPLADGNLTIEIFNTEHLFGKASKNARVDWDWLAGGSATYHKVSGKDSGDMLLGDNARTLGALLSVRLARARRG